MTLEIVYIVAIKAIIIQSGLLFAIRIWLIRFIAQNITKTLKQNFNRFYDLQIV